VIHPPAELNPPTRLIPLTSDSDSLAPSMKTLAAPVPIATLDRRYCRRDRRSFRATGVPDFDETKTSSPAGVGVGEQVVDHQLSRP
jgi:hypothetical protein